MFAFDRVRKALKSSGGGDLSFVTTHQTTLVEPPSDLLKDLEGLVAVQPVRGSDGTLLFLAFWRSSDDAKLGKPILLSRLGSTGPTFSGLAGGPITKPPTFTEKVKDKAIPILLSTVAVLGALEALSHRYDGLIAAPQFTVHFEKQDYEVAENVGTLTANVIVDNALTEVALTDVTITPSLKAPSAAASAGSFRMVDPQGTSLPATKNRPYQVSFDDLPAGEATLFVTVKAKAGLLRDAVESTNHARLVVWPSVPQATITFKQARGNAGYFSWALSVGAIEDGSSVICDLTVTGAKLSVLESNYWRPLGNVSAATWDGVDGVVNLQVTWPAIKPRSKHVAEFGLLGAPDTDWKSIAKVKPTCSLVRK